MYRTFKYFFVRIGILVFLLIPLGFFALYFVNEIAAPGSAVGDEAVLGATALAIAMLGFFAYGFIGESRFNRALKALKGIGSELSEKKVIRRFEDLLYFTTSSYFLPHRGDKLRNRAIREYADYLLFAGKDDPAALRVYLKVFLLNPDDTRFHAPLLSALNQPDALSAEEIDLLLVLFKTRKAIDKAIISRLAALFLERNRFDRKTEPVFLAAVKGADESAGRIVQFILPVLLERKRTDEWALDFYLSAIPMNPPEKESVQKIVSRVFVEGHWEAINPGLHEKCRMVFESLSDERREAIIWTVKSGGTPPPGGKRKLFELEDIRALKAMQIRLGIAQTGLDFLKDFFQETGRLLKGPNGLSAFFKSEFGIKILGGGLAIALVAGGAHQIWKTGRVAKLPGEEVAVTALPQEPYLLSPPVSASPPPLPEIRLRDSGGSWIHTIQISATTSAKKAESMIKLLKDRGVEDTYVVKTRRRDEGYWYKVRIGKYVNKEDAQRVADQLINEQAIKNYFIISYTQPSP